MTPKKVFEGLATNVYRQDSGQAVVVELDNCGLPEADSGMFVRLQSWSTIKDHHEIEPFLNKRVRITVEVVEPSEIEKLIEEEKYELDE